MKKINATEVIHIKLERGGKWEEDCINNGNANGNLRLGFDDVSHELCSKGQWDRVQAEMVKRGKAPSSATTTANRIKDFYEADEKVLWITFWKGSLWWCYSKPKVELHEDKTKTRPVVGRWSNQDIKGKELLMNRLSGELLAKQIFPATILRLKGEDLIMYLVNKINGIEPPHAALAAKALAELEKTLETVIKGLDPKDFEVLTDLIFRQMGCQRVSVLGETMKDLDLVLRSPMDDEIYGVQVKSKADFNTFQEFNEQVKDTTGITRFYFVVHTPDSRLVKLQNSNAKNTKLLFSADIARLAVRHGLTQWVIDKAR